MARPTRRIAALTGLGLTGAAGVLALTLAGPGIASAEPTPGASASATAQSDRDAARQQREDAFAAALAQELGLDKAKVAAAVDKVRTAQAEEGKAQRVAELKTKLDEAVAAGKLTREQADAILAAAEAGVLPGGHGPHGGPGGRGPGGPGR